MEITYGHLCIKKKSLFLARSACIPPSLSYEFFLLPLYHNFVHWVKSKTSCTNRTCHEEIFMDKDDCFSKLTLALFGEES